MASLGGAEIFGSAVRIRHAPQATAQQVNAFFGISGQQAIFGGSRGRTFMVSGLLIGANVLALRGLQETIMSYADGVPRILVDTFGYSWSNVIFKGEMQEQEPVFFASGAVGLPYKLTLYGLT